jgi:hypothetical protein
MSLEKIPSRVFVARCEPRIFLKNTTRHKNHHTRILLQIKKKDFNALVRCFFDFFSL